jgi:hypothetical protein
MKKSQNILQVWITKLVLAQHNRWQRFSMEHCEDAEKSVINMILVLNLDVKNIFAGSHTEHR